MSNDRQLTTDGGSSDELFMEEALRAAERALEFGEVPVGAVVVCEGHVIAQGWNRNLTGTDPTAQACWRAAAGMSCRLSSGSGGSRAPSSYNSIAIGH